MDDDFFFDFLFTDEIIEEYKKNYCSDLCSDLLFYKYKPIHYTRSQKRNKTDNYKTMEAINFDENSGICGRSKLNTYLKNNLRNDKDNFIDYIYIKKNEKDKDKDKDKDICAILIAEKGECGGYSKNLWSIKVICNKCEKESKSAIKLIGLFILALKQKYKEGKGDNNCRFGILELSGGFSDNLSAFCIYTKFGFVPTPIIDCNKFNTNNIYMTTDVTKIEYDFLKKIIIKDEVITNYPIFRPMVCLPERVSQEKYIELLEQWENQNRAIQIEYRDKYKSGELDFIYDLENIFKVFKKTYTDNIYYINMKTVKD